MSDILTRRALLGGLGCACCMGLTGAVDARIGPRSMTPATVICRPPATSRILDSGIGSVTASPPGSAPAP